MFDPREKEMVNKTIRIEASLLKRVFEVAGKRGLSFNKMVVQCVEYALDNLKPDEDENAPDRDCEQV